MVRTCWIATRLTLVLLVTVVLMGMLSTAATCWERPLDLVSGSVWLNFEQRDVVPVAFAMFAVAMGALLGAMTRRTLVAVAGTIVGYFGARYLVGEDVGRTPFAPMRASLPFHLELTATGTGASIGPPKPNDLVVSNQIVTGTGGVVGPDGEIGPNGKWA